LLIEDLTLAAEEAIERAAAEAAKAAALAGLEREAAAIREAQRWEREYSETRSRGIRNTVIVGAVCFLSGLAIGITGVLISGGR
jgi:regulator of protease activity HflC (stomatin/prohibitin superfamily)